MSQEENHQRGEFSIRLRQLRKKSGFSQAQLAERLGYAGTPMVVSHWESGSREPPLSKVAMMADVLGADLHWLLTGQTARATPAAPRSYAELVADVTRLMEAGGAQARALAALVDELRPEQEVPDVVTAGKRRAAGR